ncbi:Neurabin-1 Neurabin-I [Collichthys lucidus]|uniref:Neurabin-1 Neurabin-I n=1 Tax=Collichthys lucidus TaxID=240159 RepID=A0A4U5VRG5_COLLU|nr:Neurabin-1 Neurabin-I [Collichthys lucidus]
MVGSSWGQGSSPIMPCCLTVTVSDLNEAIPETELLDNSIQKGRAQLSVKARRHRPSRSRYRDSVSSTEGDDSLERKPRLLLRHINGETNQSSGQVHMW